MSKEKTFRPYEPNQMYLIPLAKPNIGKSFLVLQFAIWENFGM